MSTQPYALYNPAMLAPEQLLAEFTARRPMLSRLIEVVRNNQPSHPPQHVLICGPRGMGKTTLLWAVAHTITIHEPDLDKLWIPVPFDEESRRIGDLADFWLECIRQLETASGNGTFEAEKLLDVAASEIEAAARTRFLELVDHSGKRALLLIDNINDIFRSVHDQDALHRLRAFLMEDDRVMILGACVELSDDVTSIEKPFFDFFRTFELKPLDFDEMKACLTALADARGDTKAKETIAEREGSLRAIHLLTGGNPRLVKTFYRLLKDGLHRDIRVDLERLLDEFTPYFKAIVDVLPTQQQRIFDAVALAWNPVEVAYIARQTRLASNQVSSQLRALVKSGHVVEAAGRPKKKTYMLADRFSNVHYLMRHGRAARVRFDWFVVMVRLLFEDEAYAKTLAKLARESMDCGCTGWEEAHDLVANAMARAETKEARKSLLGQFVGARNPDSMAELSLAEVACEKALEIDPADSDAHYRMGRVQEHLLEDPELAAKSYRSAIQFNPSNADAWASLAWVCHRKIKNPDEAEEAYLKAIELDPNAWWVRSNYGSFLQEETIRHDEAESVFRKVCAEDPMPNTTWFNLGNLLKNLGRLDEAEAAYRKSIELDAAYGPPYIGLAILYHSQKKDPDVYQPLAIKSLSMSPCRAFDLGAFLRICWIDSEAFEKVIPGLCGWCALNPKHVDVGMVHSFTFTMWLRLANLKGTKGTLDFMKTLTATDLEPFELLSDAFQAAEDPDHLHRLAPERSRAVAEFLEKNWKKLGRNPTAEDSCLCPICKP